MAKPWQTVTAQSWGFRGVHLGRNAVAGSGRYWHLKLACGHEAIRAVRYRKDARATLGGRFKLEDALPAPKRVRCEACGQAIESAPAPKKKRTRRAKPVRGEAAPGGWGFRRDQEQPLG